MSYLNRLSSKIKLRLLGIIFWLRLLCISIFLVIFYLVFTAAQPRNANMNHNEHARALDKRLLSIFETKAQEFAKYSDENPKTASITLMIAGLYKDLALIVKA
jgi:hypothetical protein